MQPHTVFAVHESSQVGEARRHAVGLATASGWNETRTGKLALIVTELGNNLTRHAQSGQLLILHRQDGPTDSTVEVISLDKGPGMPDIQACMEDGYSSGGTPGTGLGAVRRLSTELHMFSLPGHGTVICARIRSQDERPSPKAKNRFIVGGVCLAAPHEEVSGDAWVAVHQGSQAMVMLADGLGHGVDAAAAADLAVACLATENCPGIPSSVLSLTHTRLRTTRGAAVSIVALDDEAQSLTFCGAGNVSARVISAQQDRTLLFQHGTAGLQIRQPRDMVQPWPEHSVLVMFSDGLASRWTLDHTAGLIHCHPVVIAAWLILHHVRGRDDATVVVVARS